MEYSSARDKTVMHRTLLGDSSWSSVVKVEMPAPSIQACAAISASIPKECIGEVFHLRLAFTGSNRRACENGSAIYCCGARLG